MSNMSEEKEKAFEEFCKKSLFLAGSAIYKMNVVDQNRTPFSNGFDAGVKAERDRLRTVLLEHNEIWLVNHLGLFPQSGDEE